MGKRRGNLMSPLCHPCNIIFADIKARKAKKRSKLFIEKHDEHLFEENLKLVGDFLHLTYKTSNYDTYKIYEPKERLIFRLPYYPDRIAHHAIMNVVKELWTSTFIANTYSCIEKRGIHKCAKDLIKDLKRTKDTGETLYCLKMDITKFYPSIKHIILKEILARKIKDKRFLTLLSEIIDSVNYVEGNPPGVGVPIGNYLSQFFANLYLTYFDHWCKEELKCRFYYRYADDIVILSGSKDFLRNILIAIKIYLKEKLELHLKDNYQIFPVEARGIDFVGYVFRHDYVLVRKSIKNKCKKKIRLCSAKALEKALFSYYGWFIHCNARNLIKILQREVNERFPDKNIKIVPTKKRKKKRKITKLGK